MGAIIKGDKELQRTLRRLNSRPSTGDMDRIALAALQPLIHETENRAPRASLQTGVRAKRTRANGRLAREYWVAFARGMAMRIAHLVEFGTAPHSLFPGASRRRNRFQDLPPFHPGTPPEPFFRPAFESTKDDVIKRFGQLAWEVISRASKG